MNVIVPMAGSGKRLRPHTLTTAKPLLPIAGKPIVQRLVEDIVAISDTKINEIAFVVGRFGTEIEQNLVRVAESLGAKGTIHYQDQPLGTAHAILCAASALKGPVTVAFADTLFKADFSLDQQKDGVLWVKKIDDPKQFGVVIVNDDGVITAFKEKPTEFVSDLAMIGIYYFKDGEDLKTELQYLIDNNITNSGEYQLPDALRNMVAKGAKFAPGQVQDWMDCGNKDAMVDTNMKVLQYNANKIGVSPEAIIENSTIHTPCFVDAKAIIRNCQIGPFVSIGEGTQIENAEIQNSIILPFAKIRNAKFTNSMIGSFVEYDGNGTQLSLGDYSTIKN